jgi:uncharacterized protein (DUF433 family)
MNLKRALNKYINVSPEILGGTPVFINTRVPIKILFDYINGGESIQEFLDNYPSVNKTIPKRIVTLLSNYLIELETTNESIA